MNLAPRFAGACVAFCVVFVLSGVAAARTAVVYLKNREAPITGELISEDADQITIRVEGIATPIARANVDRIEWKLTPAEQFAERRKKIADNDIGGRYALAEWAYKQDVAELDTLAREELVGILRVKPDVTEVKLLLRLVNDQIKRRETATPPDHGGNNGSTTGTNTGDNGGTTDPAVPVERKTLSADEIALLKVLLIDLDTKPRLMIADKVINDFLDEFRDHPALTHYQGRSGRAKFKRLQPYQQLGVMFEAKARTYYPKVQVRQEPKPLEQYRIKWNPHLVVRHLMRYFPEQMKDIYLIDKPANGEAEAYTNLIMLHRARIDGKRLIDANQPRQSLLLQWGLPRDEATVPAPDVPNFRAYFNGMKDPRVAEFEKWVGDFYRFGERNFDEIDYQPPGRPADPATEPADAEPTPAAGG